MLSRHNAIPVGLLRRITVIGIVVVFVVAPVLVHVLRLDMSPGVNARPQIQAIAQSSAQPGAQPVGRAFYLSATGDDTFDGLTPATAWRGSVALSHRHCRALEILRSES
jgi:hypothetical protein